MAIQKITNAILYGVAADTKPTTYANNTLFFEQDTGNIFRWNAGGTSWDLFVGASKTETLTNKTLTSPVIGTIVNTGTLTLPTSTDTLVGRATTDTLTNKTVNATNNTITDSSTATGDILRSNGTKFVRLARGSANQVLQTNSGGTDIAWASISVYTEAKGTATKSGDASTTAFTIAHTLGGTPTYYTVIPTSIEADSPYYLTVDATNITLTYNFAPPTGTSNLTYVFRAAL
jgi:hypothetical protein